MHDIEPFYHWRDDYTSEDDPQSPFYGRVYDEFVFSQKVYNYFIHPQWDEFGSQTLYTKLLFADYDREFAILEFIGEWNDCLYNDIMFLKREVAEPLMDAGISKFVLICENVLNFHGSDDCYYEEWREEVNDMGGWVVMLNTLDHVYDEMQDTKLQYHVNLGRDFNDFNWRRLKPANLVLQIEAMLDGNRKQLSY
ncbi:MAG: hypothetical protein KDC24_10050 [Saprospiraceae bacterium]|nr:hypothetical protein [Saprospiraceae bacterium]